MKAFQRSLAILLIIVLSLTVGIGADLLWTKIDETTHPRDYADSVGCENKCMIISEFGAGAIKGDTSFDGMIWKAGTPFCKKEFPHPPQKLPRIFYRRNG